MYSFFKYCGDSVALNISACARVGVKHRRMRTRDAILTRTPYAQLSRSLGWRTTRVRPAHDFFSFFFLVETKNTRENRRLALNERMPLRSDVLGCPYVLRAAKDNDANELVFVTFFFIFFTFLGEKRLLRVFFFLLLRRSDKIFLIPTVIIF